MRTDALARTTAVLLAAEGLGILLVAGWEAAALIGGDTGSVTSSIALLVLTLVGAAAVFAFGVAVWRGQSWGRSGGVVTQLLILAVALGAATGAYAAPQVALALAAPAVILLVLLVMVMRRTAPARS
ncbi:histidine kinase [Microbacterium aureliae]